MGEELKSPSRVSSRIAEARVAAEQIEATGEAGPDSSGAQMPVLTGTISSSSAPDPKTGALLGRYSCVKKAVLRSAIELDSATTGNVEAGEVVEVIEFGHTAAKQLRARCARGWISLTAASSGSPLFVPMCAEGSALVTQGVVVVNGSNATGEEVTAPAPAAAVAAGGERKKTPPGGAEKKESKFQGRHLDFLRNMAASRRKAEKQVLEAQASAATRKKKLAKKVSQICHDVITSSITTLPPQQRSLLRASAANNTMFAMRKGNKQIGAADAGARRSGSAGSAGGYKAKVFSLERASTTGGGSVGGFGGFADRRVGDGSAGGLKAGAAVSLQLRRSKASAPSGRGRAGVIFDDEVDAAWNVQAHSLQRRMWPDNYDEEKAAFLKDPTHDPQFEYAHEIEAQQRERFPVSKRWVGQAERLLDAIIKEHGTDTAFHKSVTAKRKAVAVQPPSCRPEDALAWNAPMSPEELVESAEAFLRKCLACTADPEADTLANKPATAANPAAAADDGEAADGAASAKGGAGPGVRAVEEGTGGAVGLRQAEWVNQVVEKLTVHFSQKNKGRSMSVRGCTLNVPLPITLSACRADTVWFHELGTHFLRNAVNEPVRKSSGELQGERSGAVPFGAATSLSAHAARMKASREQGVGGSAAASARKDKLRALAQKADAYRSALQEAAVPGADMVVLNRAVVRVASELESEVAAEFNGQLLPGEVITAKQVVDPSMIYPCGYACAKRAVLRATSNLESAQIGHVEVGEKVTVTQSATVPNGQLRLQLGTRGWTSELTASGDRLLAKAAGQPRIAFERLGVTYWVSTATVDGRPLLMQKALLTRPELLSGSSRKGTRAERIAAHLREQEEHTSEEGLAITNQYMAEVDHRMWRPALMYYACAKASELGFADLFAHLGKYVLDVERRWAVCARVKGGLTDTSKPGAFCRDQAYWGGAVLLLANRSNIDLLYMHMGRVNLDEAIGATHGGRFAAAVMDAVKLKPEEQPAGGGAEGTAPSWAVAKDHFVFPAFVGDLEEYRRKLDAVAVANLIE